MTTKRRSAAATVVIGRPSRSRIRTTNLPLLLLIATTTSSSLMFLPTALCISSSSSSSSNNNNDNERPSKTNEERLPPPPNFLRWRSVEAEKPVSNDFNSTAGAYVDFDSFGLRLSPVSLPAPSSSSGTNDNEQQQQQQIIMTGLTYAIESYLNETFRSMDPTAQSNGMIGGTFAFARIETVEFVSIIVEVEEEEGGGGGDDGHESVRRRRRQLRSEEEYSAYEVVDEQRQRQQQQRQQQSLSSTTTTTIMNVYISGGRAFYLYGPGGIYMTNDTPASADLNALLKESVEQKRKTTNNNTNDDDDDDDDDDGNDDADADAATGSKLANAIRELASSSTSDTVDSASSTGGVVEDNDNGRRSLDIFRNVQTVSVIEGMTLSPTNFPTTAKPISLMPTTDAPTTRAPANDIVPAAAVLVVAVEDEDEDDETTLPPPVDFWELPSDTVAIASFPSASPVALQEEEEDVLDNDPSGQQNNDVLDGSSSSNNGDKEVDEGGAEDNNGKYEDGKVADGDNGNVADVEEGDSSENHIDNGDGNDNGNRGANPNQATVASATSKKNESLDNPEEESNGAKNVFLACGSVLLALAFAIAFYVYRKRRRNDDDDSSRGGNDSGGIMKGVPMKMLTDDDDDYFDDVHGVMSGSAGDGAGARGILSAADNGQHDVESQFGSAASTVKASGNGALQFVAPSNATQGRKVSFAHPVSNHAGYDIGSASPASSREADNGQPEDMYNRMVTNAVAMAGACGKSSEESVEPVVNDTSYADASFDGESKDGLIGSQVGLEQSKSSQSQDISDLDVLADLNNTNTADNAVGDTIVFDDMEEALDLANAKRAAKDAMFEDQPIKHATNSSDQVNIIGNVDTTNGFAHDMEALNHSFEDAELTDDTNGISNGQSHQLEESQPNSIHNQQRNLEINDSFGSHDILNDINTIAKERRSTNTNNFSLASKSRSDQAPRSQTLNSSGGSLNSLATTEERNKQQQLPQSAQAQRQGRRSPNLSSLSDFLARDRSSADANSDENHVGLLEEDTPTPTPACEIVQKENPKEPLKEEECNISHEILQTISKVARCNRSLTSPSPSLIADNYISMDPSSGSNRRNVVSPSPTMNSRKEDPPEDFTLISNDGDTFFDELRTVETGDVFSGIRTNTFADDEDGSSSAGYGTAAGRVCSGANVKGLIQQTKELLPKRSFVCKQGSCRNENGGFGGDRTDLPPNLDTTIVSDDGDSDDYVNSVSRPWKEKWDDPFAASNGNFPYATASRMVSPTFKSSKTDSDLEMSSNFDPDSDWDVDDTDVDFGNPSEEAFEASPPPVENNIERSKNAPMRIW